MDAAAVLWFVAALVTITKGPDVWALLTGRVRRR
jgi:hypothetical protein